MSLTLVESTNATTMSSGAPPYQVVRLDRGGKRFEVLVKPGTLLRFRERKLGIDNVLFSEEVFANHTKMERASEASKHEVFGELSPADILLEILMKGECQLTTAERREMVDLKRRQILTHIHKFS